MVGLDFPYEVDELNSALDSLQCSELELQCYIYMVWSDSVPLLIPGPNLPLVISLLSVSPPHKEMPT